MVRRLALVTGASGGIGRALAGAFAAHGYDVALTARGEDRLAEVAEALRRTYGVATLTKSADLSLPAAPQELLQWLAAAGREPDALVNSAGYFVPAAYLERDWRAQSSFLQVMLNATCELIHRSLDGMQRRRFGRIVNVGSLIGFIPGVPHHGIYCGTKSFLTKITQSLHLEMEGTGVHVTALCPGLTDTAFFDVNQTRARYRARTPGWLWQTPEKVAAAGYDAVEANRAICIPGAHNKLFAAVARALPERAGTALMASQAWRFK